MSGSSIHISVIFVVLLLRQWVPAEHICVWHHTCARACSACCHRGLSIMERIFLTSPVQHVGSPLMRTQTNRSSLNETQMWNVSAGLDLRQLRLRGRLFPESHHFRETVPITPLQRHSAKRFRLVWKQNTSTFSVFTFQKSTPTQGNEGSQTTWKKKKTPKRISLF